MHSRARRINRHAGGRRRHGRVRFAALVVVLLLLIGAAALAPTVMRVGKVIVSMPAVFVSVIVQGGAAAHAAVQQAFEAIAQSDAVKAKLGEPLVLPAAEDVTWRERAANAPADEIEFRFVLSGSNGEADVTATLKATENNFEISRLLVTPVDGGEPIVVRAAGN